MSEVDLSANITKSAVDLSELMRARPELADAVLLENGARYLVVFNDESTCKLEPSFLERLRDYRRELYLSLVVDVAGGAPLLSKHVVGIAFQEGRLSRFTVPRDQFVDLGHVVCSIRMKSDSINDSISELAAEQVEAVTYFLIHHLSQL